jgi:D-alanine-D-alanine ligase
MQKMKTKIGVFFGGRSVEHEISVISGLQAIDALDKEKYEAVPVYITKQGRWYTGPELLDSDNYRDTKRLTKRSTEVYMVPEFGNHRLYKKNKPLFGAGVAVELDIAMPVLHGTGGEDGCFQGLLELTGIPYVGCGVLSSAVGMDKIAMKMMLAQNGIPVIDYVWFTDKQWGHERDKLLSAIEGKMDYPVIVKPANLGSSVGISRAANREELIRAVGGAQQYSSRILVERMVETLREINCSVVGSADNHNTSVCEEPLRSGEILSYADKYMAGGKNSKGMQSTKRRIPADLSQDVSDEIRRLAGETFRVLSCEGVSRVDFIIDERTSHIYVNEINTIPGSLSFYLWEATGFPFSELMDMLVNQALRRSREGELKTTSYEANIFNMGGSGKGSKFGKQ